MRLFLTQLLRSSLFAGTASALPALTLPASAVQEPPTSHQHGIDTVCTGVGSGQDDPRWDRPIPVQLVLATPGGADLAGAHVTLSKGRKTLV